MRTASWGVTESGNAAIASEGLLRTLDPDGWLGCRIDGRLRRAPLASAIPAAERSRFFRTRGIEPSRRRLTQELIELDVRAISHGLSALQSASVEDTARRFLPAGLHAALEADPPELDHVGIEIFGRLEWYLRTLQEWERRGLVRLAGHRIFPSVQVRRALSDDPLLRDVRIARVYLETDAGALNLELFEVAQHWLHSVARQALLLLDRQRPGPDSLLLALIRTGRQRLPREPVAHVALRVRRWQTVEAVHRILSDSRTRSAEVKPYAAAPCYNRADESVNSKLVTRSATLSGRPVYGRIVELISHGPPRDPFAGPAARTRATA